MKTTLHTGRRQEVPRGTMRTTMRREIRTRLPKSQEFSISGDFRLLEDGEIRLTEDGDFRILE